MALELGAAEIAGIWRRLTPVGADGLMGEFLNLEPMVEDWATGSSRTPHEWRLALDAIDGAGGEEARAEELRGAEEAAGPERERQRQPPVAEEQQAAPAAAEMAPGGERPPHGAPGATEEYRAGPSERARALEGDDSEGEGEEDLPRPWSL